MEILGIIPARGGSKSIPRKNIISIAGKPLLAFTCEQALRSKRLTRIILNTDDPEIAAVGRRFGVEVPFMRPKNLAKDRTLIIDVIIHALKHLKQKENYVPEIIVLLQPTSPMRTFRRIDEAVDLLIKTGADSAVSVVEAPHQFNPVSIMKIERGRLKPYSSKIGPLRRQDKPLVYGRNGPAVLAVKTDVILKKKSIYGRDIRPLIMTAEESIDIDNFFDLKIAECLLKCDGK